jgi:hypothetical protein
MTIGGRAASRAVKAIAVPMTIARATVVPAIVAPAIVAPAIVVPAIVVLRAEACVAAAASAGHVALAVGVVDLAVGAVVVSAAALAAQARSLDRPAECAAALVAAALVASAQSTNESTASNRSSMKYCASFVRFARIVPSRQWDRRHSLVAAGAVRVNPLHRVRGASSRPIVLVPAIDPAMTTVRVNEIVTVMPRPIGGASAVTTACRFNQ